MDIAHGILCGHILSVLLDIQLLAVNVSRTLQEG